MWKEFSAYSTQARFSARVQEAYPTLLKLSRCSAWAIAYLYHSNDDSSDLGKALGFSSDCS